MREIALGDRVWIAIADRTFGVEQTPATEASAGFMGP